MTVVGGTTVYTQPEFASSLGLPQVGFRRDPTWWWRGTPEDATPTTYTTMAGWQATGRDANGVVITGTPFTGTPSAGERDPTVYRPSAGGGLQNAGEGGTHIGAYDTDTAVVGIRP